MGSPFAHLHFKPYWITITIRQNQHISISAHHYLPPHLHIAYLHTRTFLAFVLKHQLIVIHIRGLIVPPLYQLPVTVNVYMKITVQL